MFEVPRQYGAFDELFKALGARETANTSDYSQFLGELHRESGGEVLNPNELAAVLKVLNLISSEQVESFSNNLQHASNCSRLL